MSTTTVPAGRWQHLQRRRAAATANPQWYTKPQSLHLMSGQVPLATVRSNGRAGAEERWLLQVSGWEWQIHDDPSVYHQAKAFRSRAGAQIEAEDIVAAASDWSS